MLRLPPLLRPILAFFLLARVVAAPSLPQLVRALVPLLSQAFFGLLGLPPLPTLAIALLAAVRHAGLLFVRGRSERHPDGRGPRALPASGGIAPSRASIPFTTITTFHNYTLQLHQRAGRCDAIRLGNPLATIFEGGACLPLYRPHHLAKLVYAVRLVAALQLQEQFRRLAVLLAAPWLEEAGEVLGETVDLLSYAAAGAGKAPDAKNAHERGRTTVSEVL